MKNIFIILIGVLLFSCGENDEALPTYQKGEAFGPNNEYRWHPVSCDCQYWEESYNNGNGAWYTVSDSRCLQYSNKPE